MTVRWVGLAPPMCVNVVAGEVSVVPAVWHYSFLPMALEFPAYETAVPSGVGTRVSPVWHYSAKAHWH